MGKEKGGLGVNEYLTTKELADLLRLKERKIYDMAAAGEVPCTRATGKLLFPRAAIEAWLEQHTDRTGVGLGAALRRPDVVLGSHDPLLEWALRESRSGLATYFDSSRDGLNRFADGEGIATGLHIVCDAPEAEGSDVWNVPLVRDLAGTQSVALIEWAWRRRGLILPVGNPLRIKRLADLAGRSVVPRQPAAGTQVLFEAQLAAEGITPDAIEFAVPALSETDAALAVLEGRADAAFGLEALAAQYRLDFVPVVSERFDLLVDRRSYFDPPLQKLFAFTARLDFAAKAASLAGYDISGLGTVHFNGR